MSVSTLLDRADKALGSAKLLLNASYFEASVSRAYYAMFYAAEAALLSKGIAASTHKGVITQLNQHFIKTGVLSEDMGLMISRASAKRQLADYADASVITQDEAEKVLLDAEVFVGQIRHMLV